MSGPVTAYLDRLAPRSRRTYLGDARAIAQILFGRVPGMPEIRTEGLEDGLAWHTLGVTQGVHLCEALAARYAPSTARRMVHCYRGILRECWRQGRMSADALARALDLPPIRGERISKGRALSWPEVELLLAAARGPRDRAMLSCMVGAGLRRAEVVSLVPEHVLAARGRIELLVQGKGRRQRKVRLPDWASANLSAYVKRPWPWSSGELVFGLAHDASVEKIVRATARRAGLGPLGAHDLRRTYASLALGRGMSLATLRRSMGHSSVKTTTIYDRRPDDEVLAEAARLDAPTRRRTLEELRASGEYSDEAIDALR